MGDGDERLVTVVIATRDRCEQLCGTLQRLSELPERPPVVVVDNGSTDGTAAMVESVFPDVALLPLEANVGAQARTLGVMAASTPYVAFADDDSWWAPGSLALAADLFGRHPRLGLLAARILVGPDERVDPVCLEMAHSPLGREADLPGVSVLGFVACGAVVRRSAYLEIGGFSPVVFFLGEETVVAQDLAAAGWGLAYVPDVVALHWPSLAGPRRGRQRLQTRNALLSTWMRRPPSVCVRETGRVLRDWSDADSRGAVLDALRRLPAALRARQPLPAHVEAQVRLVDGPGSA